MTHFDGHTRGDTLERIAHLPAVLAARRLLHERDEATLADQLELVQIPAPPLEEGARAARMAARFHEVGLAGVEIDEVGNVLAHLPGTAPGAPLLLAAHLDTVFPLGTDLRVRREGGRLYAPGIGDNARGLAALLAIARALVGAGVHVRRPVVFAATVGEEGVGDLKGVKHLFRHGSPWREAAAFLSLDGTGMRRVVHRAVGARRLRVSVRGPGGHSWADWGRANPIDALALGVTELLRRAPSRMGESTLTVGRIGGGTSVNAIPAEAWLELDLRSEDGRALSELEARVRRVLESGVLEVNRRRTSGAALDLEIEVIGDRPCGVVPPTAPLVAAACAATRFLGELPELAASSTDANVPIALGIPALTLGAGGASGGAHTTGEWYGNDEGALGVERALLVLLMVAGVG